ncbi:MAG: hypothetical protein ACXIUD_17015 [Mongoliitalea sp.]
MTREQLEAFRKAYANSVKKCIKGIDKNGQEIDQQSDWVFFDRALLQSLLDMTDPQTGGLKMYFGQYDKSTLDLLPEGQPNREDYLGRMSIAIAAANKTEKGIIDVENPKTIASKTTADLEESLKNGGELCPPSCNP